MNIHKAQSGLSTLILVIGIVLVSLAIIGYFKLFHSNSTMNTSFTEQNQRDVIRITDSNTLAAVINESSNALQASSSANFLCSNNIDTNGFCEGSSNIDSKDINGTGWIKADLSKSKTSIPSLLVDPLNDNNFHYIYCADKNGWEIIMKLEDPKRAMEMSPSSNINLNSGLLEKGTNLNLSKSNPRCHY